MPFYATDPAAVTPDPGARAVPGQRDTPSKNRVWDFLSCSETRAGFFVTQPLESHREIEPTPTTFASGVRYYGFRYYGPSLGRWLNRDPLADISFNVINGDIGLTRDSVNVDVLYIAATYKVPVEAILDTRVNSIAARNSTHEIAALYTLASNEPIGRVDFLGLFGFCTYACAPTTPYDSGNFFFRYRCAYRNCGKIIDLCFCGTTCPDSIDVDFIAVRIGPFIFCPGTLPSRGCN